MPLTVNVGLNRKRSRDYQSQGTSINITAELDPALLANPDRLQSEIAALYRQAEVALTQQSSRDATGQRSSSPDPRVNGVSRTHNQHPHPDPPLRSITGNQIYALQGLAESLTLDLESICNEVVGKSVRDMNIREASKLIDQLKARIHRTRQLQHSGVNGMLTHTPPDDHDQQV